MARGNGSSWNRCQSSASLEIDENASDESDFFLVRKGDNSSTVTEVAGVTRGTAGGGGGDSVQSRASSPSLSSAFVSATQTVPLATVQLSSLRVAPSTSLSFLNTVTPLQVSSGGAVLAAAINRKRKFDKEEKESLGREGRKTRTGSPHAATAAGDSSSSSSSAPVTTASSAAIATSTPARSNTTTSCSSTASCPTTSGGAVAMVFGKQYSRVTSGAESSRHTANDGDRVVHWHPSIAADVDQGLAADFDDSLTGLGVNLSSTTYNMSEALLALPSISNMSAILKNEVSSLHSDSSSGCAGGHESPLNNNNSGHQHSMNSSGGGSAGGANRLSVASCCVDPLSTSPLPGTAAAACLVRRANTNTTTATASATAALLLADQDRYGTHRFQYILNAATSLATKINEEPITYLNQGQSYEISIKRLGDLSGCSDTLYLTRLKLCFYERRLQYIEKEQLDAWRTARPGDRLLEIDVPLSYGIFDVRQGPSALNSCDFMWSPHKSVGVYVKVHSVSTEFTPKKHGGEKGVPFRLQAETYTAPASVASLVHCAAAQIKVFKLKGADRKHKLDRERVLKRPPSEQEKFQPSFDCTLLVECPLDSVRAPPPPLSATPCSAATAGPILPPPPPSPCSSSASAAAIGGAVAGRAVSPSATVSCLSDRLNASPSNSVVDDEEWVVSCSLASKMVFGGISGGGGETATTSTTSASASASDGALSVTASCRQVVEWLAEHRFAGHTSALYNFTGADLMRLSRDDAVQICGLADGVRLYNSLHSKLIAPRLTLYVRSPDSAIYHAIFLQHTTRCQLLRLLLLLQLVPTPTTSNTAASSSSAAAAAAASTASLPSPAPSCSPSLISSLPPPPSSLSSSATTTTSATNATATATATATTHLYVEGPAGVSVLVTDEVVRHLANESLFTLERTVSGDSVSILLRKSSPNRTNHSFSLPNNR